MKKIMILLALAGLCRADTPREANGFLEVEAERFDSQDKTDIRKWHVIRSPEGHSAAASRSAYIEVLPDTRTTHDDKLIPAGNFSDEPGRMAVLHYRVEFTSPGRYFVWVRAYSTGTEDNGIHVGMDGTWPGSGRRMQWCEGKNTWRWASAQRTQANHCGEPGKIYLDVAEPGAHTISFSMREDGFEFDKWIMTKDPSFQPSARTE
jgi:hypothetical protein